MEKITLQDYGIQQHLEQKNNYFFLDNEFFYN